MSSSLVIIDAALAGVDDTSVAVDNVVCTTNTIHS